jgi:hypothetical protein
MKDMTVPNMANRLKTSPKSLIQWPICGIIIAVIHMHNKSKQPLTLSFMIYSSIYQLKHTEQSKFTYAFYLSRQRMSRLTGIISRRQFVKAATFRRIHIQIAIFTFIYRLSVLIIF